MKTNRVIINSAEKFLEHKKEVEPLFDSIEENGVFNIDDAYINRPFFDACKRYNISYLIMRFSENTIEVKNDDIFAGVNLLLLRQCLEDTKSMGMARSTISQLEKLASCLEENYDVIVQYQEIY